ncbi:CRISPR-associated endonuclease Cas1 [Pelomicrobium methylotrophicum]|uniref:CRISPR-associated endonuclease Cas1 n=1 Tax=Pelomicrobium methylotrophicum TaxID=2602750 RepID=A0A5C7EKC8_9PROT|nr:CRISPR-associated endonuclease Cas1 [Pelomicrobium methylotrophicum]TXF11473.1 CRISPR-associated endonuclease Cas1 [Pelomicrobium methylotrophicum]
MATLVLDRSNLEVRADGAALALYEGGERRGTVPLNLIERVILQGAIRLDTAVLVRLAEEGVATVLLSRRQSRRVAFLLGPVHSDAAVRLGQYQLAMDAAWCGHWARRIVLGKVRAQARLLRDALAVRPDCRKALTDALSALEGTWVRLGGEGDVDPGRIRGMEGAAASAYFRGLVSLFPPSLGFCGRNRRPPRDPVNACLSLGYTLLHFEAVRACHMAGLDPLIGFYHRPAFGRESMACDLVEPLRPRVDGWVWRLFRERRLRGDHFVLDKGACLLHKAGREHFYQDYEAFVPPLRRLLRRECALLARRLKERGEPQLEPLVEGNEEF